MGRPNAPSIDSLPIPETLTEETFQKVGVLTFSFYTMTSLFQRVAGMLSIHSGRNFFLRSGFGLASVAASAAISYKIQDIAIPPPTAFLKRRTARDEQNAMLRIALMTVSIYGLFERKSFNTLIPSSVISLGIFARPGLPFNLIPYLKGAVPATGVAATEAQRARIQTLGRRFGCHHCGSRQFLGKSTFIADHQPPTKFAEAKARSWWRRITNIKVKQQLWPQCQKCFSIQGSAVRAGNHVLIYHNRLRPRHFAPALAYLFLTSNPTITDAMDEFINVSMDLLKELWKEAKYQSKDIERVVKTSWK